MNSQDVQRILESVLDGRVRTVSRRPANATDTSVDDWLDAKVGRNIWHLAVDYKASPGRAAKRIRAQQAKLRKAFPEAVPVLVVPRLSQRERQQLRDNEVNHLDLGGNVWIRSPGLFVTAEGNRSESYSGPRQRGRNPFSKKASLVARVLLTHGKGSWRVRDLAGETSLSLGYTSEILRSLVNRGYAAENPDGFSLSDPVSLLRDWSAAYRWEDNKIRSFVAPFGKQELIERSWSILRGAVSKCALTLLAASDRIIRHVEHDQVHIYVSEFPYAAERALRTGLHAEPVARGGNLHVLQPYYGEAVWYGVQAIDGLQAVSDVQLFLDLVHYPVRGPEAAAVMLKRRLGPSLRLDKSQVRSLSEELGL